MTKRPQLMVGVGIALVLLQQQVLLQRPPRLLKISSQHVQSGTAALDLQFSRPMDRSALAAKTSITPSAPHQWFGEGNPLRVVMDAPSGLEAPIKLELEGVDRRQTLLQRQRWWWDPRPWLVVTRRLPKGEQVQLQTREGDWIPLSPIWPALQSLVPLGNGKGIAMVSSDANGKETIWWRGLQTHNISRSLEGLKTPSPMSLKQLRSDSLLFGHLSTNLNGDLLVQSGGLRPGSDRVELLQAKGSRQRLAIQSAGPIQLLPAGGGLITPTYNGLTLRPLIDKGAPLQMLPGSRELGAFCGASGKAVLVRHWPDYRRSIELVIPGAAPKQLHLGEQAVLALACDGKGQRIWAVLGRWQQQRGAHELVLINTDGTVMQRRSLNPWTVQAGTPMQWDAVGNQLLLTLSQAEMSDGRAALLDADNLQTIDIGADPIGEAQWLQAG